MCSKINYMFNWIAISSFLLEVPMNKNLIKRNEKKSAGPGGVVATISKDPRMYYMCYWKRFLRKKCAFFLIFLREINFS